LIFFLLLILLILNIKTLYRKRRGSNEADAREIPPRVENPAVGECSFITTPVEVHFKNMLRIAKAGCPQADRVLFYLYEGDLLVKRGEEGHLPVERPSFIRLGEGLLGWIAKEKKTVSIANLHRTGYADETLPASVLSLLTVPILEKEHLYGLLHAESPVAQSFSIREEELLQQIAGEMLVLLRDDLERQQMKQQAQVYSTLLEISKNLASRLDLSHRLSSTAASAKAIIAYDGCFIFLVDAEERQMTVKTVIGHDAVLSEHTFPLTGGLISLIVRNRQPLLFSDAEKKRRKFFPEACRIEISPRSFLGLPLIIEERVIGVLVFTSDREDAFSSYDRHVLSIMCNQVATSIAQAQVHAQMSQLAMTDGLTGLLNHRRFFDRLTEEFVRSARHPEPFSLLLIDVDHFKQVNDGHGHPAGDAVLKMVSETLMRQVRKIDVVARYGGEEFAILLPRSDANQALLTAERIRKAVEAISLLWQNKTIRATISIGIAEHPNDATDGAALIASADRALYGSKQDGRNRTTLYQAMPKTQ
jgi:diguanylate cyclase (GGDEF)-like protein